MQKNLLQVAAYARVSTDKEDQVNSLVSQRKYFAEYINKHPGWKLSGVYYDEGASGTQIKRRTGFNQMITDALSGKFDLILTKEVSRFARNTVDTLLYTRQLKSAGVGVIFTIDNIDTRDSDGELRLTIMAGIAQEESRKISERVKWGQKRRMEQGVVFGRDMLGYNVKKGVLYINKEEACIVKSIFHKYTNEGKGVYTIARELTEKGIRSKHNLLWTDTVISRVLKNEKYVGDLCQKKTYTPDYLTHKKKYNKGIEEKVYIYNHHEPVIDRELWDRTQKELARRSSALGKSVKYSNRYWCSGKIRCGECGCQFVSRTKKLATGKYLAWRCYKTAKSGSVRLDADGVKTGCSNNFINNRTLLVCMKYCMSLICNNNKELYRKILSHIKEANIKESPFGCNDIIFRKIDSIESKKRKLFDGMFDGILTKEELRKQLEWYDNEMERLLNILEENKQDNKEESFKNLEKNLDEIMEFGEENEILYHEVLERIDVYKELDRGCNNLVIWMQSLSFGIGLKTKSMGKGEGYHTEILETYFIDKHDNTLML